MGQLAVLREVGHPFALVTVVGVTGSTPRELGAKLLVETSGRFWGTVGGGRLEQLVLADARSCLLHGQARAFRYPLGPKAGQCCGGLMEVFVEPMLTGPRLYLFGGGHVGQALCQVLVGTPFTVELVEEREEWLRAAELPAQVVRHGEPWEDFIARAVWDSRRTFVAVMTHQHDLDQSILEQVLRRPSRYVGLIGSAAKWRRFQDRLAAKGFRAEELERVHCPIGLKVGGKSPREVGISVAAELLQTFHGSALPPT